MGSIVLKSLSILLGIFFIFVGITKLTPFISKELHKDLFGVDCGPSQPRKRGMEEASDVPELTSAHCNLYCTTDGVKRLKNTTVPHIERKEYVRYAKVFPFTDLLDFKVPSKWYRRSVGGLEILFGLALAVIPSHKVKNTANIGLVLLMVLAAYSHVMVGDPFDRCAPALVFFFMLTGRLVVWYQTSRREELEKAATTQNGNGLKRD